MIPIKTTNIENICKWYCEAILKDLEKDSRVNIKKLDKLLKKIDPTGNVQLDVLLALNPKDMKEFAELFNRLDEKEKKKITGKFRTFKTIYKSLTSKKIFVYQSEDQKYLARKIVEDIDIKVCPYCNRNFIIDTPKIRSSEFDHFYSQKNYPFFALSFYNLVPSCKVCNHGKNEEDKDIIHPYDSEYKFDKIEFDYEATGVGFLYDESQLEIKLNSLHSSCDEKLKGSKDVFDLENLYKYHRDVVLELIQKREAYPEGYIEDLEKNMIKNNICTDRNHFLRLITGNFVEEENVGKRPLAKLNRDIAKKLGFIE